MLFSVEEELTKKLARNLERKSKEEKKGNVLKETNGKSSKTHNHHPPKPEKFEKSQKLKTLEDTIMRIEQLLAVVKGECDFMNLNIEVIDKMEMLLTKRYTEM